MQQFEVLLAAPAEVEIEDAYLYIRRDCPVKAVNWRLGLLEAAQSLETFPRRCAVAPENGAFEFEIRQLIYGQ